jgi:hypothetical protein
MSYEYIKDLMSTIFSRIKIEFYLHMAIQKVNPYDSNKSKGP